MCLSEGRGPGPDGRPGPRGPAAWRGLARRVESLYPARVPLPA
ncbi:hypothetical protein RC1_2713 [Rhodospirillum centenum SW]|uniref:Uncharacterized protein n=1 Tax=Rhodospirillum centenum (strain ATCC 51521 / SW) TaxID=414684 RepID=B6IV06_RHOCS|nr:hypothetical protein RC1_2713 [Rhodospirillum centenum SW]